MNILITGGTGFIGAALRQSLLEQGHSLVILSREGHADRDHCRFITSLEALSDDYALDAIINLAGASMAGKRWTVAYKEEIVASRIDTTRALVALIRRLEQRPAVLLSASAIGYYGPNGSDRLDENTPVGNCFSSELCDQWEQEASAAQALGVRVCFLRLGVVLDSDGGAMIEMARPFRMGFGNWIGSGQQWLSWIHRDDAVAAMLWLLASDSASGAFNVTAPEPVTSKGFCEAMQRKFRTLLALPMPAFAMRLLVGEMADELLITGQRVVPARLQAAGFTFNYPEIDSALDAIIAD
ncbi:MAG: TIGR01777 family oxidoreductase [Halieaceae bacterium]